MEIDAGRAIILGIMTISAFSLGFIFGKAYLRRKMRRREDEEALADYLPEAEELPPDFSMVLELNQERLIYLLKIMHRKSIEYFENENSYEIRLIPELQQAYNQIHKLIKNQAKEDDDTKTDEMVRATQGHQKDA